jgi:broad specificity phosphatase PhoE
MRLYITRHGESVDDIEDCYGGIADFELTDNGRAQGRAVANSLVTAGIQYVYTSPLRRARETAEIIATTLSLPVPIVVDDLQERNTYGVLSGVNKDRAKEIFSAVLARLSEPPGYSPETVTGGEDFDSFVARVRRAMDTVVLSAQEKGLETIAVVTHGKFSHALYNHVWRITEPINLKLSSINTIDYTPPQASLAPSGPRPS